MVRTAHDHGILEGTVAVGVDGSPWSPAALAEAVRTAGVEHRSLTILHAVEPTSLSDTVLRDARAAAKERSPGLEVHLVRCVEDPRDMLVAASERAAVVVVGSRGRGPVRSLLLGSVSLAVSRRAACPVIVVRPHHPGLVRHGVLVGADAAAGSRPALEFAFRRAAGHGLPLTVLHVVAPVPLGGLPPYDVAPTADDLSDHRLALSEAMAGLRENYPDVAVRVEVLAGYPTEVLVREAERMDLLVLGGHGGFAPARSLHPVGVSVLERARCPVAVVPIVKPVGVTRR